MKKILLKILRSRARNVIRKHQPRVVAITGSMGKTSTREAIRLVLEDRFDVRSSVKNYNNEFGVPLTILGEDVSPGKSIFGWIMVVMRSFTVAEYPEVLVLEFGADRPGDIAWLCSIARPDVAVVTGVSPVHAANFENLEALVKEKETLVHALSDEGVAILNGDDVRTLEMHGRAKMRTVLYGTRDADMLARDIEVQSRVDDHFEVGELIALTTARVMYHGGDVGLLELRDCLGYTSVMNVLAALAVGEEFGICVADAVKVLNMHFLPGSGRLRPLAGIKGSIVIDDSYNAAPAAMLRGLELLQRFDVFEGARKIAVLGQMAELGDYTEQEHRMIGLKVAEVADAFVAVGSSMQFAIDAAEEAGMSASATELFGSSEEAEVYVDREIQSGDVVYVKGSQSSRMERVVKGIMAEPLRAEELLVRQSSAWVE